MWKSCSSELSYSPVPSTHVSAHAHCKVSSLMLTFTTSKGPRCILLKSSSILVSCMTKSHWINCHLKPMRTSFLASTGTGRSCVAHTLFGPIFMAALRISPTISLLANDRNNDIPSLDFLYAPTCLGPLVFARLLFSHVVTAASPAKAWATARTDKPTKDISVRVKLPDTPHFLCARASPTNPTRIHNKFSGKRSHEVVVFAKNARQHSANKILERLSDLMPINAWDVLQFSEKGGPLIWRVVTDCFHLISHVLCSHSCACACATRSVSFAREVRSLNSCSVSVYKMAKHIGRQHTGLMKAIQRKSS